MSDDDTRGRAALRDLVRRGYDVISTAYRDDGGLSNPDTDEHAELYRGWVEELARVVRPGGRVLDLGCGCGLPSARELVRRGFRVTGIDISAVQVGRARTLVPEADFIQADMALWDADPASLDAVVALYALIHVPLQDQRELLPRVRRWLRPGGVLMAIVGSERWTGVEDYLGAPMFWDHADSASYLSWLRQAGLIPMWDRYIPEGPSGHVLVLARAD